MSRLLLTDEHWRSLKPIMLESDIYDKSNLLTTLEGALDNLRIGCRWCNWPSEFGRKRHWITRMAVSSEVSQRTDRTMCCR